LAFAVQVQGIQHGWSASWQSSAIDQPSSLEPRSLSNQLEHLSIVSRDGGNDRHNTATAISPQGSLPLSGVPPSSYDNQPKDPSGHAAETDVIVVSATMNLERCPRLCKCQCHIQSYFRTPEKLRETFGRLLFSYTSLIWTKNCNYPPCRTRASKSQLTYYFPRWRASRAVVLSSVSRDLAGPGASLHLRTPIVNTWVGPTYAAMNGNIDFIRQGLSTRSFTPQTVGYTGRTLLHVSGC